MQSCFLGKLLTESMFLYFDCIPDIVLLGLYDLSKLSVGMSL